jgi:hypothetical protein
MSGDGREPALAKAGVAWLELEGNSNAATSVAFLKQLKEKHPGPLKVIWDNAPAHRGEALREYLRTPGLELQLGKPRATCVWGAERWCKIGWAGSWRDSATAKPR